MTFNIKKFIVLLAIAGTLSSCHEDLNQTPIDPDSLTEAEVFANETEAKKGLAKLYASLALTGQKGPDGDADIQGFNEGFSQYTRMLFNLNEVTTDHAVVGWGDPGLPDLHGQFWTSNNDFIEGMYNRLGQQVSFCNSFITNASKLTGAQAETFVAEARFLRAFAYYNLIDLYANVPLTTKVSTELPQQSSREEIFNFVEAELLDIQDKLLPSKGNEYGRVDQVASWALLSRLYLNAEVWTATSKYNEAASFSEKVINSSYSINTNDANGNGTAYDELFLADNNTNGAQNEFIFALNFDGLNSKTWGGSSFLIHAAIGGTMNADDFGVNGGWAGLRTTKALVEKFEANTATLNAGLGTLSNWGIVGSSTPNQWNGPDIQMYETASNEYSVFAQLTAGEIKFRENNDWANNFGDDGADGTIEAGGANIVISNPGTYRLDFNLNTNTYTVTEFKGDLRGMFHSDGQNLEISDITKFEDGFAVTKFKNITSAGVAGNDPSGNHTDTDLPIIRLAEIYLNYAEAILKGGSGNLGMAVAKINELRERAYGNNSGNITTAQLTLDFVLNERSRELYWEGQRRTDLVRYNQFTTDTYLWPFKGNTANGSSVDNFRNIFPIPASALAANPNLKPNPGY